MLVHPWGGAPMGISGDGMSYRPTVGGTVETWGNGMVGGGGSTLLDQRSQQESLSLLASFPTSHCHYHILECLR